MNKQQVLATMSTTPAKNQSSTKFSDVPTKYNVELFLKTYHPLIAVSYSGRNNTYYLTGAGAEKAELELIKKFVGLPFKTHSSLVRAANDVTQWYFNALGEHSTVKTTLTIFECPARDLRNAKRKFGNYITSLTDNSIKS